MPMSPSGYDSAFSVESLSESVESFAAEFGSGSCSKIFDAGRKINVEGDIVAWDEVQMGRHLAPVTGADSPAVHQNRATRIARTTALFHVKVYKDIPASKLYYTRAPGSDRADQRAMVGAELKDLTKAVLNTREYLCAQALLGTITANSTTIPGSTISASVAFGNNTYSYSADWATTSSDLHAEAKAIRDSHIASGGSMPYIAVTEPGILAKINANDKFTSLVNNLLGANLAVGNSHLDGFGKGTEALGFDWRVSGGVYKPLGGSVTQFIPADKAIFLPGEEELDSVLGMAEGYGAVLTDDGPARAPARGFYSYMEGIGNPVGCRLYAGWVGIPLILQPSNVTVATLS